MELKSIDPNHPKLERKKLDKKSRERLLTRVKAYRGAMIRALESVIAVLDTL